MRGPIWKCRGRELRLGGRALVMGVLNVTPDSFSDGGRHLAAEEAVARALRMAEEGADLIDVGGESSRPGAEPVPADEELRRVLPVVRALADQVSAPVSVDTTKAEVAAVCLRAGAAVINDITGLRGDPGMADLARETGAGVVVMHMRGTPATMQQAPAYADVAAEVAGFFAARLAELTGLGLAAEQIVFDPGIGFGKTAVHNLELLASLDRLTPVGRPLLVGVSRKSFVGHVLGGRPPEERLFGSLGALAPGLASGAAAVVRVHDVGPTRDFVELVAAVRAAGGGRS